MWIVNDTCHFKYPNKISQVALYYDKDCRYQSSVAYYLVSKSLPEKILILSIICSERSP